jgi:hypothetical protein
MEEDMTRKFVFVLLLVLLVAQFRAPVAFAARERGGSCPPGFTLEMAMDPGEHEHMHHHAGTSADQNGDGYICMKPVTPEGKVHVHIDNSIPQ